MGPIYLKMFSNLNRTCRPVSIHVNITLTLKGLSYYNEFLNHDNAINSIGKLYHQNGASWFSQPLIVFHWQCFWTICWCNPDCMQDWDRQDPTQIVTEMCGFVTILSGTFLLHKTKDMVDGMTAFRPILCWLEIAPIGKILFIAIAGLPPNLPIRLPKHAEEDGYAAEEMPLRSAADGIPLRSPRATESFRATL